MSDKKYPVMMRSTFLTFTPLIKVRDKHNGKVYIVGDSPHDQFVIGKGRGLHYYNLQCGDGTGDGTGDGFEFALKEPDYDFMDRVFEKVNFLDLMDLDADRFGLKDNKKYLDLKNQIKKLFAETMEKVEKEKIEKLFEVMDKQFKEVEE